MLTDKKPFDHDAHCRLLEEADYQLRSQGKESLAGAVMRARMIHIDEQGRITHARQAQRQIQQAMEKLRQIDRLIADYVSHSKGPWIGSELFPETPA
jgi:hypothetical protein